jgi:hypothetical protein
MHAFPAYPANSPDTTRIYPALASFVDEVYATLARLCAYVMALALIALCGMALWDHLPEAAAIDPVAIDGWSPAGRAAPAFAVSQFIFKGKTEAYEVLRHPEGGRKHLFHWSGAGERRVAELEIYRPGHERRSSGPTAADIAARMGGAPELETAGIIDSKFGPVTLLRPVGGSDGEHACLGFIKPVEDPAFRLSGWSCQGDDVSARRAAIGCMLDRLILLTAGNDMKLAELFAHAELRRSDCAASATLALSADWLTGASDPLLRGAQ